MGAKTWLIWNDDKMPNPEDIATEDLAPSQSSVAISSAHHHGARSIFVFLAELVSSFRIL